MNALNLITEKRPLLDVKLVDSRLKQEVIHDLLQSPSTVFRKAEEIFFTRKFYIQSAVASGEEGGLEPGQVLHYITTRAVDRMEEIVEPKGGDLRHYRMNPLVLWAHSSRDPDDVIGLNRWIKRDDKGLRALTQFDVKADKAAKIYGLYQRRVLRGWSIGFIPIKGHKPDDSEEGERMAKAKDDRRARYVYDKWLLLEYSAAPIPANQEALTEEVAKSIDLSSDLWADLKEGAGELFDLVNIGTRTMIDMGGAILGKEVGTGGPETEEEAEAEGEPEADDGDDDDADDLASSSGDMAGGDDGHEGNGGSGGDVETKAALPHKEFKAPTFAEVYSLLQETKAKLETLESKLKNMDPEPKAEPTAAQEPESKDDAEIELALDANAALEIEAD